MTVTPDLQSTLDAIDAATGCQQCEAALGPSPSDDFCSEFCQQKWSALRVGAEVVDWGGVPIIQPLAVAPPDWRYRDYFADTLAMYRYLLPPAARSTFVLITGI